MKLIVHISSFLKNKYLVAFGAFAVIMLFLDKNDLFTQLARARQLKELQGSKQYYLDRISAEQLELARLGSAPGMEKKAREAHLMKRENEDLFLVPENPVKAKN
jgi:cell division protein DivIC